MREFGILIVGFTALLLGSANAFAADGAAVYKANCARCHGESGTADTPVAGPLGIKPFQGVTPERVEAAMAAEEATWEKSVPRKALTTPRRREQRAARNFEQVRPPIPKPMGKWEEPVNA